MRRPSSFSPFLAFALFAMSAAAQPHPGRFMHYGPKEGLPNDVVNKSLVDARGFLWIATNEGLSRFDGSHFRQYLHDDHDTTSFPGDKITELFVHAPDTLYLLSNGNPVELNTRTHLTGFLLPSMKGRVFQFLGIAEPGLTLATSFNVTYLFDRERKVVDSIVSPPEMKGHHHHAWWLSGSRYFVTCRESAYIYDRSGRRFTPFLTVPARKWSPEGLQLQHYDAASAQGWYSNFYGGLFLITDSGIIRDHLPVGLEDHMVRSGNIGFVTPMPDGSLWVGMHEKGIQVFDRQRHLMLQYIHDDMDPNSLSGTSAISMFIDQRKNIWVSTNNGVNKLQAKADVISTWDALQHGFPPGTTLTSMQPGPGNTFYLSSYDAHGIYRFDPKGSTSFFPLPDKEPAWTFAGMGGDIVITGPGRKLRRFDPNKGVYLSSTDLDEVIPNTEVVTLAFQQRDGTCWYSGNRNGGLIRSDAHGNTIRYKTGSEGGPLSIGYYQFAAEDRSGDLYFGNIRSRQIAKWDHRTGDFHELDLQSDRKYELDHPGGVTFMTPDATGALWVSFEGGGIVKYDPETGRTHHYRIQDGLPTNYIYHLQIDGKNRLWAASQKGLSCLDVNAERFIHFNSDNGLPEESFEQNCSWYDSTSGMLWFGSTHHIVRFHPDSLLSMMNGEIRAHIDGMLVNGKIRSFDGHPFFLSPRENNIGFQFVAPSLDDRGEIEYSFRLTGANEDWSPPSTMPTATYANLRPGDYKLELRSRHAGDKEWVKDDLPAIFNIAAPWYMMIWARIMFGLLLVGLITGGSRIYYQRKADREKAELEKQQAIERERTRIATDMHDDFGSSLSRIKFLSEKSLLDADDRDQLQRDLTKITRYSTEMSEKMGEVVWALNNRYDNLGDLVSFCRAFAAEYLEDKPIQLEFFAEGPMDLPVSGELRRNLFLIMKEALNNTAKHSGARKVAVRFRMNGLLRMEIEDDGSGFDPGTVRPFANGLENISKRAEQVGGTLELNACHGTHLVLTVDPSHPTKGL